VLDYAESDIINDSIKWGTSVYALLKKYGKITVDSSLEDKGRLIYVVTLARIIGEFGKHAFGDHLSDELEIDIASLDLNFNDVEPYLDKEISPKRREELRFNNCVDLQDIWTTMWKYKKEIHRALMAIYTAKEERCPEYVIYESLLNIFKQKDKETGEMFLPYHNSLQKMKAYLYIDEGFDCDYILY